MILYCRPGSIIVDHLILMSPSLKTGTGAAKRNMQCAISETLFKQHGMVDEDLKAHTDDELGKPSDTFDLIHSHTQGHFFYVTVA